MTPIDDMAISCRTHCICPPGTARKCTQRRQVPGSNAFVPSVAGLIIAGEVVKDLGLKGDEPKGDGLKDNGPERWVMGLKGDGTER